MFRLWRGRRSFPLAANEQPIKALDVIYMAYSLEALSSYVKDALFTVAFFTGPGDAPSGDRQNTVLFGGSKFTPSPNALLGLWECAGTFIYIPIGFGGCYHSIADP